MKNLQQIALLILYSKNSPLSAYLSKCGFHFMPKIFCKFNFGNRNFVCGPYLMSKPVSSTYGVKKFNLWCVKFNLWWNLYLNYDF